MGNISCGIPCHGVCLAIFLRLLILRTGMGRNSSVTHNSRIATPNVLLIPTSHQLSDSPSFHDVDLQHIPRCMQLVIQRMHLTFLPAIEPSVLRHRPLAGGCHPTNKLRSQFSQPPQASRGAPRIHQLAVDAYCLRGNRLWGWRYNGRNVDHMGFIVGLRNPWPLTRRCRMDRNAGSLGRLSRW